MKYIIGLLSICFCLMLSVDVGAVEQPIKTEFVTAQAPVVFCEPAEVGFAIVPAFVKITEPVPYSQPGESHGNLVRSCDLENVIYCQSLQFEAPNLEQCRHCTAYRAESASAKETGQDSLSDWKVGWEC